VIERRKRRRVTIPDERISSKERMYSLYREADFGNSLRTWSSFNEMIREEPEIDLVGLRTMSRGKRRFRTMMTPREAVEEHNKWVLDGCPPNSIVWCEALDTATVVMNGQAQRSHEGLCLTYSRKKGITQQEAVWSLPEDKAERQHARGLTAFLLLQTLMDWDSFENLNRLLDKYPTSIIEFTISEKLRGPQKWNTVFWEVRDY
jgi:hypothetical protein